MGFEGFKGFEWGGRSDLGERVPDADGVVVEARDREGDHACHERHVWEDRHLVRFRRRYSAE